jgi:hypothetical protein
VESLALFLVPATGASQVGKHISSLRRPNLAVFQPCPQAHNTKAGLGTTKVIPRRLTAVSDLIAMIRGKIEYIFQVVTLRLPWLGLADRRFSTRRNLCITLWRNEEIQLSTLPTTSTIFLLYSLIKLML